MELEGLPGRIEALETEQRELNARLADFVRCKEPGFVAGAKARLAEIDTELAAAFARWEELGLVAQAGQNNPPA